MALPSPLQQYIAVQKPYDQAMRRLLLDAANEAEAIVRSYGTKTAFDKTRMLQASRDLRKASAQMFGQVDEVTRKGMASAARKAANSERWFSNVLQDRYGANIPEWEKALGYSAENGIASVMARQADYVPLSKRVYKAKALTDGKVDDVINRGLLLQKSAAQIAEDVRKYISPNTPGGTAYAANRLARTEINHAFHAQQIASREEEPWTQGFHWNLSGSHPKPDECNEYAEKVHFKGGGVGDFQVGKVPGKPHPNCLCFITTITMDEDEFVDQFVNGNFNTFIDQKIYSSGVPTTC